MPIQKSMLQCQCQVRTEIMFRKRSLHKYVHIYTYVKSSLPKTQSLNLALALQAHFLGWRLTRFGKELFIYVGAVCSNMARWVYIYLSVLNVSLVCRFVYICMYTCMCMSVCLYVLAMRWDWVVRAQSVVNNTNTQLPRRRLAHARACLRRRAVQR